MSRIRNFSADPSGNHNFSYLTCTRHHIQVIRDAYRMAVDLYNDGDYSGSYMLLESLIRKVRHLINNDSVMTDSYDNAVLIRYHLMILSLMKSSEEKIQDAEHGRVR